jgi:exopolyphosphatase/pppGpp-phosphohydrolase
MRAPRQENSTVAHRMTVENAQPAAAAIDIGSNSIKMTVAHPDGKGGIAQIDWASDVVRLGQGVEASGVLAEDRVEHAIATLTRFAQRAHELGATRVVAVATEATRAASNGEAFLARVRAETGIDVRAINGQEEAELTFRGIAATTDISGPVVIADIGGGSTEFIVARDGIMQGARSAPLGSGRLTDRLISSDPPTLAELAACELHADDAIAETAHYLPMPIGAATRLVVVGGTGEFLARLVPDERQIEAETVRQVLSRMATMTASALAREIEIPEARARVLPAGIAIVAAIAARVQPGNIEIASSGVRAGLLLDAFREMDRGSESALTARDAQRHGVAARRAAANGVALQPGRPTAENTEFRETMKSLIAERWDIIWKEIPVALDGSDIEGVHDLRVASRRLRAAMDIAAPAFAKGWYKPLQRAAKEITSALGEVRDRDVLLEALRADRDAAPLAERPGIDRLIGRVERESELARAEMEQYLKALMSGPLRAEVARRFGSIFDRQEGINDHGSRP